MLKLNKGFTLIELLVVITIIGILATGATAVYTSQIQKARDTTRINDINQLKSAVEQIFQDAAEYPEWVDKKAADAKCDPADSAFSEDSFSIACVTKLWYISKLPTDPKSKQIANWSALDYTYAVAPVTSVVRQAYEISAWLENEWNLTSRASKDNGNDNKRFEVWVTWLWIQTNVIGNDASTNAISATTITDSVDSKITKEPCWPLWASNTKSTSTQQSVTIVVKWDCKN